MFSMLADDISELLVYEGDTLRGTEHVSSHSGKFQKALPCWLRVYRPKIRFFNDRDFDFNKNAHASISILLPTLKAHNELQSMVLSFDSVYPFCS